MILFTTLLLASSVWAASNPGYKVKEAIQPPQGWTRLQKAPSHHTISLQIALPQSDFAALERHLLQSSDPDHKLYGAHLSKEEVDALVAPHPSSLKAVNEWLTSHGLKGTDWEHSSAKDWINVVVPVGLAEKMLETVSSNSFSFRVFEMISNHPYSAGLLHLATRRVWRASRSRNELQFAC